MLMSELLNAKLSEIKRPPNLPVGHYILSFQKFTPSESGNGDWINYDFEFKVVEPTEDVDPEELKEYGNVQGAVIYKRIMLAADADEVEVMKVQNRLKMLAQHLGHDDDNVSLNEAFTNLIGANLIGEIVHNPSKKDPENIFQNVGRTAPLA